MFFAAWWRSDHGLQEPLRSRVQAIVDAPGAAKLSLSRACLAAWKPAHLRQSEKGAVAYAVKCVGDRAPQGHPSVHLEDGTLKLISVPLLEYPLYYVRDASDEFLLACSLLEPLARLLPAAPMSARRLVTFIAPGALDPDAGGTVYAGIRRLLPGETVVADAAGIRSRRSLPRVGTAYRRAKPEDLAGELRHHLDAAVGRLIDGAARVAVIASGGLDSSGILALAAGRCRTNQARELLALNLEYAAPLDDRPYFDQLTRALHMDPLKLSPRDAAPWFQRSLCADAQPFVFGSACLDLLIAATAVEHHVDVALHGGGGDAILGGPLAFAQLARRGRPLSALRRAWRLRAPWPSTPWRNVRGLVLWPLLPRRFLRSRRRPRALPWMTRRTRALADDCYRATERSATPLPDTPDEWMRDLCEDQGRCESAAAGGQVLSLTGCATVDAFTDLEFVRFMLEIDPITLYLGDEYKGLYRLAMKGVLPEGLRTRQDKGRIEPGVASAALGEGVLETLRDLSSLEALATHNLIDPGALRALLAPWFEAMGRGERSDRDPADEHWHQVWQLLSIEAFLRQCGRGRDLA